MGWGVGLEVVVVKYPACTRFLGSMGSGQAQMRKNQNLPWMFLIVVANFVEVRSNQNLVCSTFHVFDIA